MNNKLKHKPKKNKDETILRTMLLNINDHCVFSAKDYDLSSEKFNVYILALVKKGIVSCAKKLPVRTSEDLIISDIPLFNEWNRDYKFFINQIIKSIIPILSTLVATIIK